MNGAGIYWRRPGGSGSTGARSRSCCWSRRTCCGGAAPRPGSAAAAPRAGAPARRGRALIALAAALVVAVTGGWIFYNTNILNDYRTKRRRRSLYGRVSSSAISATRRCRSRRSAMSRSNVELYPRADPRRSQAARYRLTNLTGRPISEVHVRTAGTPARARSRSTFRARALARDDAEYGYRIYRLDRPMAPGESRSLSFRTRRWQTGFRNSGADTRLVAQRHLPRQFRDRAADRDGPLRPAAGARDAAQIRAALRAQAAPAGGRVGDGPHLFRRRLVDRGHHRLDRRRPDADRAGPQGLRSCPRRPAHRPLRLRRADPDLLLDPVGALCRARTAFMPASTSPSITIRPTAGTSIGCSTRCRHRSIITSAHFGPYQFDQARIIEFPGYAELRPGLRQHHALFGGDRLHRRQQRSRRDRLCDLCHRARARPPILGAPGDRRRHAGQHDAVARRSPNIRR